MLLILAGVALRMVAGNEGILTKAEIATSETEIAGAKEQTEIMLAELSAEYYEKKFVDKTEVGNLVNYIKNELATAKPTSNGEFSVSIHGSGKLSVTDKSGNTVVSGTLDENGKIIWNESTGGNGGAVVEPPLEVPENPVASYDVSEAGDGSVMEYVVAREGETDKYDILVIGQGKMTDWLSYGFNPAFRRGWK